MLSMLNTLLTSVITFSTFSISVSEDQLVFLQTVFRHGDRTPTGGYPTDPYQEAFWDLPWGELTKLGMKQSFLQGLRVKKMYIDDLKFLTPEYSRTQIRVLSSDSPRCVQSALSQMAGLYSASRGTHPEDLDDWPAQWTPIPVHSRPKEENQVFGPGEKCPKAAALALKRKQEKAFVDFLSSNSWVFERIHAHIGRTFNLDYNALSTFYNTVKIERDYYNLTMPAWITDDFYNALESTVLAAMDYTDGAAGFGKKKDKELIRLRGGFLLHEWVENLKKAASSTGPQEIALLYSGHDSTVSSLLLTLEAKSAVLTGNTEYTATVACELWKRDNGAFYVRFLYSANVNAEFRPITAFISGCPENSEFCELNVFLDRSAPFEAKNGDCKS